MADSFYMLNDIKINKSKSALLLRLSDKKKLKTEVDLRFGDEIINIRPVQYNETERFFDV